MRWCGHGAFHQDSGIPCCDGSCFPEDVRVPTDQFTVQDFQYACDVKVAFVLGNLRIEQYLQYEVAKLFTEVIPVSAVDRVQNFVDFLHGVSSNGFESLFPVPRTAIGPPQPAHEGYCLGKLLSSADVLVSWRTLEIGRLFDILIHWLTVAEGLLKSKILESKKFGGTPPLMLLLEVVFAVLFGLVFGSFLNVCIVRLPKGESIVRPPSHCRSCGQPIRPLDNVPLLSWIILRGLSRCCKEPIPLVYPLVEAGTAFLFVGSCLLYGFGIEGICASLFCWLLFGLIWMDAREYLLPDAFTLPGIMLGILCHYALPGEESRTRAALFSTASAAAIGGVLMLTALLYKLIRRRDGMGFGDVKLGAMTGAWLGWRLGAVSLFIAVLTGAVTGLVLTARRSTGVGAERLEPGRLPFGAFLAGAGILTVFAGKPMLAWYMGFFP